MREIFYETSSGSGLLYYLGFIRALDFDYNRSRRLVDAASRVADSTSPDAPSVTVSIGCTCHNAWCRCECLLVRLPGLLAGESSSHICTTDFQEDVWSVGEGSSQGTVSFTTAESESSFSEMQTFA